MVVFFDLVVSWSLLENSTHTRSDWRNSSTKDFCRTKLINITNGNDMGTRTRPVLKQLASKDKVNKC